MLDWWYPFGQSHVLPFHVPCGIPFVQSVFLASICISVAARHVPVFLSSTMPFSVHSSFNSFFAFLVSIARVIAPDESAPTAIPTPEPNIADDAAV